MKASFIEVSFELKHSPQEREDAYETQEANKLNHKNPPLLLQDQSVSGRGKDDQMSSREEILGPGSCLPIVQRLLLPGVFCLCYCKLYNATTAFSFSLLLLVTPVKLIGLESWTSVQSLLCTGFSFWDVMRLPRRSLCLTIPGKCLAVAGAQGVPVHVNAIQDRVLYDFGVCVCV